MGQVSARLILVESVLSETETFDMEEEEECDRQKRSVRCLTSVNETAGDDIEAAISDIEYNRAG